MNSNRLKIDQQLSVLVFSSLFNFLVNKKRGLDFVIGILILMSSYTGSVRAQNIEKDSKRPNIILLLADDMRASTIHALGNPEIITPNLDKLVKEGMSFPHTYIMGGTSGAVCMPSRAMLMTGKNLFHLVNDGSRIPETHTLLGSTFQSLGYQTYGIGKWHNGPNSYTRSFTGGDEIMFGGMPPDQYQVPLYHYRQDGKYDEHCKPGNKGQLCDHIIKGKHSAEIFADASINFLKSERSQKPFFLYVAFTTPHDPRQMPQEYRNMYDVSKISLPANFLPKHPFDNGEMDVRDELLLGFPRKPEEVKKEILDYYAIITHLDAQVGRIIQALKESGQYDNTIIIFSGDNGLAVGQHGLLGKQNLYEHSIGVPMIWSGPGIAKNQRSEAYAYLTDIYPTLCDVLKVEKPASVDGKSFFASFKDSKKSHRETMFFAYKNFQRAINDKRYKLIEYNVNNVRHTQLFDLKNDPYETKNLFGKPDFIKVGEKLKKELIQSSKEFDDKSDFWNGYN